MTVLRSLESLDRSTPMGRCLHEWHRVLDGDHRALGTLLADDAVLHSPVVFKPLVGKDIVTMYLTAAAMSFVGARPHEPAPERPTFRLPSGETWDGRFRYVREVVGERDAILEFETTMQGKYVNGVDMIRCDEAGMVVDFKVMVRPLQALDAVRELMVAALGTLQARE